MNENGPVENYPSSSPAVSGAINYYFTVISAFEGLPYFSMLVESITQLRGRPVGRLAVSVRYYVLTEMS